MLCQPPSLLPKSPKLACQVKGNQFPLAEQGLHQMDCPHPSRELVPGKEPAGSARLHGDRPRFPGLIRPLTLRVSAHPPAQLGSEERALILYRSWPDSPPPLPETLRLSLQKQLTPGSLPTWVRHPARVGSGYQRVLSAAPEPSLPAPALVWG